MKTIERSKQEDDVPDLSLLLTNNVEHVDPPYLEDGETYADIPELPAVGRTPEQIAAYLGFVAREEQPDIEASA